MGLGVSWDSPKDQSWGSFPWLGHWGAPACCGASGLFSGFGDGTFVTYPNAILGCEFCLECNKYSSKAIQNFSSDLDVSLSYYLKM